MEYRAPPYFGSSSRKAAVWRNARVPAQARVRPIQPIDQARQKAVRSSTIAVVPALRYTRLANGHL